MRMHDKGMLTKTAIKQRVKKRQILNLPLKFFSFSFLLLVISLLQRRDSLQRELCFQN